MSTPAELRQIQVEIHQLEEFVNAQVQERQRAGKTSALLACALVLIVLGFVFVNFTHLRAELTQDKVSESLSRELGTLSPVAIQEIGLLGRQLLPIYAAEFKKQLEVAWPQISVTLQSEADALSNDILLESHKFLVASEERILKAVEMTVEESFPHLQDPAQKAELERKIDEICQSTLTGSLEEFDTLFSKDVAKVRDSLLKFELSDVQESPLELKKRFIHLWLQLLDMEVMEL
jgi:hypothetical protein